MLETEHSIIYFGNNLDVLPKLEDNSVDSIVTDPPYELGFMGKKWDSSGIAYNVELWKECLRVLKPGGHLLAFSGSRTYHRMTVAIEDSGFEVRDMIAWISNKTFPKSLDISKAIDKSTGENQKRQLQFTAWMRDSGLSASKARQALLKAGLITEQSNQASHYFAQTIGSQPAIATAEMFDALRPHLPEVPEEIERLVAERTGIEWTAYKNRRKIGQRDVPKGHSFASEKYGKETGNHTVDETESHTPEAKQWEGWGTALKPTVEPIVMARKPLIGTVAQNVLEHGTGGLNIDKSRIGEASRWPANVILDEYSAEILDEQSGTLTSGTRKPTINKSDAQFNFLRGVESTTNTFLGDTGGASRFFYVPRASKIDRSEGLETENNHPTVKPTALMTYLINLVTPPNGTVLDPFTGSGSTGKAAIMAGFNFVGIELTEDYYPIIEGRLKHAEAKLTENKDKEGEQLF